MSTNLATSVPRNDERPLPLIVAEKWGFPLQYHQQLDGYLYAMQDWAIGLVGNRGKQVLKDFKRSKSNIQLVGSIHQLPYKAIDGKTYKVDFCTDRILYLFAQHARVLDEREVLAAIRRYLADAGVLVDELRRDPELRTELSADADPEALIHASMDKWRREGKTDTWIEARIRGIITRKQFTEALRDAVLNAPMSLYGQATETVYKGLWQRTTAQLRGDLALTPRQNIRDHFGEYALIYTYLAEKVATDKLGNAETVSITLAMEIVMSAAKLIRKQAQATAKELGIDLVTEKPLLGKGQRRLQA